MPNVIVAATPLAGHTQPLIRIAQHLVAADDHVRFIGGARFEPEIVSAGATMHALTGQADYDDRRLAEAFPERSALPPGPEQLNFEHGHIFGDAIPDQHQAVQTLLQHDPNSVLVSDNLFLGAWPSALGAGRAPSRWISIGITPLVVASADTTPMGPAVAGDGEDARAANLAANRAITDSFTPAYEHIIEVLRGLGATRPQEDYIAANYALPDVTAQLSVPEFDFPHSDLPARICYAGHLRPAPAPWRPSPRWAHRDRNRPVVLVTQGTVANHDLGELIEPTLSALADWPGLTVAALGRTADALSVSMPANALAAEYVPFEEVLPMVDVFITNGGYGATQQALAAGVPVIVAGATEDKPFIAARVAYCGVGIDLQTQRPTPEQIRQAVDAVMSEPGYRSRAQLLAGAYARYDALELIEGLVRA